MRTLKTVAKVIGATLTFIVIAGTPSLAQYIPTWLAAIMTVTFFIGIALALGFAVNRALERFFGDSDD